jgi:two-component system, OmpR family, sensor histidine kinase BaeS
MRGLDGLAIRLALASLAGAVLTLVLVGAGILWVGYGMFEKLMLAHGASVAETRDMFAASVTRVLIAASAVALLASIAVALVVSRLVARPIAQVAAGARRIGEGAYGARVPRPDTPELASLADSFNQMSAGLRDQQRERAELIANFAHELRTPLTNLQGYLQALRDGVMQPSSELFGSLDEEVSRLHRLSRSLDVLAAGGGPDGGERTRIDLVPIVDAACQLCRPALEARRLEVSRVLPADLMVRANPDQLAQVVLNLLQNAARYTPEGGRVTIAARRDPDSVLVAVSNTGPDIPADDMPHLFERFYRVDKSRDVTSGGAGIGLAIVRQLVEAAGGRVGAESGGGLTRFWFTVPS